MQDSSNNVITRTQFGELRINRSAYPATITITAAEKLLTDARTLVAAAASRGKLAATYDEISFDRKGRADGGAIHHEIYDINPKCTRVLVCVRATEGTKYGVKTTSKEYFVVARHGNGIRVLDANKSVSAKAAKAAGSELGVAIETALGKRKLAIKADTVRTGYKLLVRCNDGTFESAWDKSGWRLGQQRIEAASGNHTGGFYYYATLQECLNAASSNDVFGSARSAHRLAIVEVAASGRHYAHHGKHGIKLCATKLTPLRELGSTL